MLNPNNCDKWFYTCLALIGLVLAGLIMIFRYFLRIDKNSIKLGVADKQHEHQHGENLERIKRLEQEKEKQLAKVEKLEVKITLLEKFINKLTQPQPIYTHHPTSTNSTKSSEIPKAPPPPAPETKPSNQQPKPTKKGNWDEIHEAIKKRRKDMGEED